MLSVIVVWLFGCFDLLNKNSKNNCETWIALSSSLSSFSTDWTSACAISRNRSTNWQYTISNRSTQSNQIETQSKYRNIDGVYQRDERRVVRRRAAASIRPSTYPIDSNTCESLRENSCQYICILLPIVVVVLVDLYQPNYKYVFKTRYRKSNK